MPEIPRKSVREVLLDALQEELEIPAFSPVAKKLMEAVKNPKIDLDGIAELVQLDPGITSKYLKLASSPSFGGSYITSVKEALMIVGLEEAQRVATTIIVIGRFLVLKVKIDWELFWLHSLLTARLLEKLADSYRQTDGREYLAGLLHDIGKLYIGHHFPNDFEKAVIRAMVAGRGLFAAERELFDITHAEVGSKLCEQWKLQPEIVHAILHHHEPFLPATPTRKNVTEKQFLAVCLHLADKMANITRANIQGAEAIDAVRFEDIPEWKELQEYPMRKPLVLDLPGELKKARDIISSISDLPKDE